MLRPTPANLLIEVFRYLETLITWGLQCFNATIVPQGERAAFATLGISRFWPRGSEFRPCLSIRGLWPLKMEADRRRRRLPSSETSPRHHRHQRRQQQQHLKEVMWWGWAKTGEGGGDTVGSLLHIFVRGSDCHPVSQMETSLDFPSQHHLGAN